MLVNAYSQSIPSYVPTNGLVGWWPFNGNANDESGNGNNGTNNNCTFVNDRNGLAASAISLNGTNAYIDVPQSTSLNITNAVTISTWAFLTSYSNTVYIGKTFTNASSVEPYQLVTDALGHLLIYVGSSGGPLSYRMSSLVLPLNQWVHLTATANGTTFRVYINGVDAGVTQESQLYPFNGTNNYSVKFGKHRGSYFTNGSLDDIGIWNRALTQQEITNLYTASTPPPCNPLASNLTNGLVGYWPFCGNAQDESGSGNNGTLNGATLTSDRFGITNSAYAFNGSSSEIIINHTPSLSLSGDMSFSLWLKTTNPKNSATMIHKYQGGSVFLGFSVTLDNTNARLGRFDLGKQNLLYVNTLTQDTITDGIWHHLVGVVSGNLQTFYLDGVLQNSLQNSNVGYGTNSAPLVIGNDNCCTNNRYFDGVMDDIAIWNHALTQNEITQLYTGSPCITYQTITVTDTLIINANLTGINPVTFQNSIKVYPNPASTSINIDFGSNYATLVGYSMRIDNSIGQTVYTTPVNQQLYTSNLNGWSGNGLYLIYLLNPQGAVVDVRKIVIQ